MSGGLRLVVLCAYSLLCSSCANFPDECTLPAQDDWSRLSNTPGNLETILINTDPKVSEELMNAKFVYWYERVDGSIASCRFVDDPGLCGQSVHVFRKSDTGWERGRFFAKLYCD